MSSQHNKPARTSLLDIPPELRLQIFSLVLTAPSPFQIIAWRTYTPFCFSTRLIHSCQHQQSTTNFLTLLLVNRQIYHETRLLPFQLNTWLFKSSDAFTPWFDRLLDWQVGAMRTARLVTWMGRRMLEGEGWVEKRVEEVFPVQRVGGLRVLEVEIGDKASVGECRRREDCGECAVCDGDEMREKEVRIEEERVEGWARGVWKGVQVRFERVEGRV